jgi:hypothetical protein
VERDYGAGVGSTGSRVGDMWSDAEHVGQRAGCSGTKKKSEQASVSWPVCLTGALILKD